MNWNRIKEQLRNDGLTHEEIEARLDELLDQDRAEDEEPEPIGELT
jgi:hypothetical protein